MRTQFTRKRDLRVSAWARGRFREELATGKPGVRNTLNDNKLVSGPEKYLVSLAARSTADQLCSMSKLRSIVSELVDGAELARHDAVPLEMLRDMEESPRLVGCDLLETPPLRARNVGAPLSFFSAFLDGKQKSEQIAFVRGIPIVAGTVAAAIRVRDNLRATTWRVEKERTLYAPLRLVGNAVSPALHERIRIVDTSDEQSASSGPGRHPVILARLAYTCIERDRERLEYGLASEWLTERNGETLLVDGSISRISSGRDDHSVVGLVKSHRTMYLQDDEVETVLALAPGERSSAFRVDSRGPVASWYLRLRRDPGCDPLFGLVRVEIPLGTHSLARADEVSRWVLAETSPISLPDARWDRLVYGVRDCEMFLAAVM